jgi:hypothetical protein
MCGRVTAASGTLRLATSPLAVFSQHWGSLIVGITIAVVYISKGS